MTATTEPLPDGHPLSWDEMVPYEKDQGGYWLYPKGCDVYGNGKIWVRVPRPEEPGELERAVARVRHLAQQTRARAGDTTNPQMAELAGKLEWVAARFGG